MSVDTEIPEMNMSSVRRVVAGHDAAGRSRVLCDNSVPLQGHPGIGDGAAHLWGTDTSSSNEGIAASVPHLIPGAGGSAFVIVRYPPDSQLETLPPELIAIAQASPADQIAGLFKADLTRHPRMHYSNTVDYGVVLSGEVVLLLDEGEVTLRAGDTYVLRGAAHAWSNCGAEAAVVAVVLVGSPPSATKI